MDNRKCYTPEDYIQKYIKGETNDVSECENKNCDIIITFTQDRDPNKLFEIMIADLFG